MSVSAAIHLQATGPFEPGTVRCSVRSYFLFPKQLKGPLVVLLLLLLEWRHLSPHRHTHTHTGVRHSAKRSSSYVYQPYLMQGRGFLHAPSKAE
jgi:hypothetical protein